MESDGMRIPGKRGGYVGDDATWRFIECSLRQAKRMVMRERERIQLVAEELVKRGRLDATEIETLLRR